MDILYYSAIKENTDLVNCYCSYANTASQLQQCCCTFTSLATQCNCCACCLCQAAASCYNAITQFVCGNSLLYSCYQQCILQNPGFGATGYWCNFIPGFAPGTNPTGFKVCAGASGCPGTTAGIHCQCGACYLWTVPSGATYIRFQMWGAGAGTGSGCCCGAGIGGATGGYSSIIIPAVTGCQYSICAGCATCCVNLWCYYGNCGTPPAYSCVTGNGLSGVFAAGADPNNCSWMYYINHRGGLYLVATGWYCCVLPTSQQQYLCNGFSDICMYGMVNCGSTGAYNGGCYMPGLMYSCNCYGGGSGTGIAANTAVFYIPSMFRCYSQLGCCTSQTAAPVFGYESSTQCSYTSVSTTQPCVAGCGYMVAPGAGGSGHHIYGGCTYPCWYTSGSCGPFCGGDMGRGGMVCVSYI
jgi:hypothetical protein